MAEVQNACMPLPVELILFKALFDKDGIHLHWQTASEVNNYGFEIQKSGNGIDWNTIDFVEGKKKSSTLISYEYIDEAPYFGINLYRLKQIDFDGAFEYSDVITVFNDEKSDLAIYPNPVINGFVHLNGNITGNYEVIDRFGRTVKSGILTTPRIDITGLANGFYILQIRLSNSMITKRFFKR